MESSLLSASPINLSEKSGDQLESWIQVSAVRGTQRCLVEVVD